MRGEYSEGLEDGKETSGSPPLARGVQPLEISAKAKVRITPACAGSTIVVVGRIQTGRDHPRLRGEYLIHGTVSDAESGSPPLARGVLGNQIALVSFFRITPACAGSTLAILLLRYLSWDHPRLRGEYRQSHIHTAAYPGSPPLARGVPSSDDCDLVQEGITPACAGST